MTTRFLLLCIVLCAVLFASCAIPAKQVVTIDNRVERILPTLSFPAERKDHHAVVVLDVAFSPDGKKLLVGTFDDVIVWTLSEQPTKRTILRVAGVPRCVKWSHSGALIAVSEYSSAKEKGADAIHILDSATGQHIREIPAAPGRHPRELAFSADDSLLAWSEYPRRHDGHMMLMVMSLKTGEVVSDSGSIGNSSERNNPIHISKDMDRIYWHWRGWKLQKSPKLALSDKRKYYLPSYAYSPDGRWGYVMAPLYRHDIGTYKRLRDIPFPEALYQIDLASGKVEVRRQWLDAENTMYTYSMAVSPDGRLLAIGTERNGIHVIDLVTNRDLGRLVVPEKWYPTIDSVVFSPDGKRIAGCSTWGACIWEVPSVTQEGSK